MDRNSLIRKVDDQKQNYNSAAGRQRLFAKVCGQTEQSHDFAVENQLAILCHTNEHNQKFSKNYLFYGDTLVFEF